MQTHLIQKHPVTIDGLKAEPGERIFLAEDLNNSYMILRYGHEPFPFEDRFEGLEVPRGSGVVELIVRADLPSGEPMTYHYRVATLVEAKDIKSITVPCNPGG